MIQITSQGDFSRTFKFLEKVKNLRIEQILHKYGAIGVSALSAATPVDSGLTSSSWSYQVSASGAGAKIEWINSNVNKGVNIAVILQYGHGTGTGGYVQGRDYINPAMRPVFDQIANEVWKEVVNA